MAEEQGQALEQPALSVPAEMSQFEAVDHITNLLEEQDKPVARDPDTGKFQSKKPPEEPKEEAKAEDAPAEEEPAEEDAPPPPRKLKLKYKGEELEKDEDEVISLAQQGFDYTQKSQAIAKEREELSAKVKTEVEAKQAEYLKQLEVHRKALEKMAGIDDLDLNKLSQEDPVRAQQEFFKRIAFQQQITAIEAEQQKATQQRTQEMQAAMRKQAEEAVEALQTKIAGWNNDLYGKVLKGAVKEYGFKQQEVNAITDHRAIEVLHDAMKWRELQAAKPKTVDKRVAAVPKVTKPGTTEKADPKANRVQERMANLQKQGSRDAGAAYFEELLAQGKI